MSDPDRCERTWGVKEWPYVNRCKEGRAVRVVLSGGEPEWLCWMHAKTTLQSGRETWQDKPAPETGVPGIPSRKKAE